MRGSGSVTPGGDYQTEANLEFSGVTYAKVRPFLAADAPAGLDGRLDGRVSLAGPLAKPAALAGELRLNTVEIHSVAPAGQPKPRAVFALRNNGPVVAALKQSVLTIQNARLEGPGTHLALSGSARLEAPRSLDLRADGRMTLEVLEALDPGSSPAAP